MGVSEELKVWKAESVLGLWCTPSVLSALFLWTPESQSAVYTLLRDIASQHSYNTFYTSLRAQMVQESVCNTEDPDLNPGTQNSIPGYPLQHSCLESSMGRGAWWATVHRVTKSWTISSQRATNNFNPSSYILANFFFIQNPAEDQRTSLIKNP